jgi:alpha-D-xyloside xylohydrolase
VIPKIPEDVMTLVPQSESGNTRVKAMDDRRVYEVMGNHANGPYSAGFTDFEGRKIGLVANTLKISGDSAAHIIVRWRFLQPTHVTVNGTAAKVERGEGGVPFVEFDHLKESVVGWQ